jgi:hypothetical protein
MLSQSDVQGRLRLFRYGVIVVVITTFFVTLVGLFAFVSSYLRPATEAGLGGVAITDFLGQALTATVAAAIIGIIAYVAYHYFLTKKLPFVGGGGDSGKAA